MSAKRCSLVPAKGGANHDGSADHTFVKVSAADTGQGPRDCRIFMIADDDRKYIQAPGFAPVLFDHRNDPCELRDLGRSPAHEGVRLHMRARLADWALRYRQRETCDDAAGARFSGFEEKAGVLIGYWDENDMIDPANASALGRQPASPSG